MTTCTVAPRAWSGMHAAKWHIEHGASQPDRCPYVAEGGAQAGARAGGAGGQGSGAAVQEAWPVRFSHKDSPTKGVDWGTVAPMRLGYCPPGELLFGARAPAGVMLPH